MTNNEKIASKVRLKAFALRMLGQRVATAQAAMERAQEAANTEEKSSSGDKYETGRAMGQLEKEMYAGLGKQEVEGLTVLFVSPAAPLARSLQGKKPGGVIMFNRNGIVVEEIY